MSMCMSVQFFSFVLVKNLYFKNYINTVLATLKQFCLSSIQLFYGHLFSHTLINLIFCGYFKTETYFEL